MPVLSISTRSPDRPRVSNTFYAGQSNESEICGAQPDLHFRASLCRMDIEWSTTWVQSETYGLIRGNTKCTKCVQYISRDVIEWVYRVQRMIDHQTCLKVVGEGKRFEPIGRIVHCPGYHEV